jgi:hypothetical protein
MLELDSNATAELYAARALYLDAVAGDMPYKAEEVLNFLGVELEPFWQRLRAPMDNGGVASSGGLL